MIDIGTDIVDIKRIAALIEKHGPGLVLVFLLKMSVVIVMIKLNQLNTMQDVLPLKNQL